ncbi:MAG: antitoxin MazE family protein [Propionibacteriaceae bacterium]|nr:antitoxin MazE family protein [Propionibacteriaceae bacterium]
MTVIERVGRHRSRLREQGFRPIQVWVPDTSSAEFQEEARRQSRLAALHDRTTDDQDFIDAISAPWDD